MPMTRSRFRSTTTLGDEEDVFVPDNGTLHSSEQNHEHASDTLEPENIPINLLDEQAPIFPPRNSCDRVLNTTEDERVKTHLRRLHKKYVTTLTTTLQENRESLRTEFSERYRVLVQENARVFTDIVQSAIDGLHDEQSVDTPKCPSTRLDDPMIKGYLSHFGL